MFSKEYLYINAIKYKTQLKINYKKLNNNDIVETNASTFLAYDEIMGRDIATKLVSNQSEIDNTYISTLLLQDETKLIQKKLPAPKDYAITSLNEQFNIAVSKNTLFETRNYFDKCGIDYIFSAYHILNLHIEKNPCNNNLVILLFNNQAFCVILNSNSEIVFNKKIDLTPFEEIKKSEFYENELLGQKLFDEVYALELYETIKNTIEEFYSITKNMFIEKVSLLYNLKLVSDSQISKMSEDFMLDITYHPISVDEELFELSRDSHKVKSFIKPRKKPNNKFKNFTLISIIFILLVAIGYLFYPQINELINKKDENIVAKKPIEKKVELPNHIEKNNQIESSVLKALEVIPYDVVLKELDLDKNSLSMEINLLNKDTFIKVLQPELLKYYDMANIVFKESKTPVLEAQLKAEGAKQKQIVNFKDYKEAYIENEFMPIIRVTEQMKILFPEGSNVTFKNSFKSQVTTFNYLVTIVIQKPLEFFTLIDKMNNELYSINITYPISFVKTEAGIEVEFIVQFHQPK
ncbi:hypothetical protein [Halarcobacter sp.]|uniref:hypothetical protein n=1 Tax=Halarcobacter sp. TaxID=2321133 RepID=UPI002AAB0E02|nr:hypothetical protein [Halarcobacter sp.]